MGPRAQRQPWKKVLWREQAGYADNHTDDSFLESLTVSMQPVRDYWQVSALRSDRRADQASGKNY